ncbi:MAG: pantetheine-phosphate adenylyltransferase [Bacteroidota bacterium]
MRKALFAGSFDPIHVGHVEIVRRAVPIFDEVLVAIGVHPSKKSTFSLEDRREMLARSLGDLKNVSVHHYEGLTVEFARKHGAQFLLRGLRAGEDIDYERNVDLINQRLGSELETVFLLSDHQLRHVSSTLIRQVMMYGGDLRGLIPEGALPVIERYHNASL